jgi:hypothetical protein
MNAWTNSPYTTVIGDFEYSTGLLETLRHQAIFKFALANAHGKWIVPPTAINHRMSKQEFAERLMSAQGQRLHRREFDSAVYVRELIATGEILWRDWSDQTSERTWEEISTYTPG